MTNHDADPRASARRDSSSLIPTRAMSYNSKRASADAAMLQARAGAVALDQANSMPPRPETSMHHQHPTEAQRRRGSHKPKSSGGFLLQNPLLVSSPKPIAPARDNSRRRSRIPIDTNRGKSPIPGAVADEARSSPSATPEPDLGLGIDSRDMLTKRSGSRLDAVRRSMSPAPRDDKTSGSQGGRSRPPSRIPSPRPTSAPLDADSAQIVNMALNLSESRRLAARRNVSTPIPPRLTPVPDSPAPGGTLKNHLQQQRRSSRTMSPKPENTQISHSSSLPSPLQLGFDHEGSYNYQFSSSTLNRAQKAKEQLELMAQYRRLMQFLPPLHKDVQPRLSTSSSRPTSPDATRPTASDAPTRPSSIGRSYNPLQYIRNRKVRARERRTIDGRAQGFGDVARVADWVDETATRAATSALASEGLSIPHFPGAHEDLTGEAEAYPSNIPRPIASMTKSKRPRMDWSIEPADMLADVYWVEQGDNKHLIEDRNYSRIFPRETDLSRPQSHQNNQKVFQPTTSGKGEPGSKTTQATDWDLELSARIDPETATGARDRARQKLSDLRSMHHRHNSSSHIHNDLRRLRRGSLSETSDSESDRRRKARKGTITADGRDLLERQLMEIMVDDFQKEEKENINQSEQDPFKSSPAPTNFVTPERTPQASDRELSSYDDSALERENRDKFPGKKKPFQQTSPLRIGRASLDVPGQRMSMDVDRSLPPSPDMRPSRRSTNFIPTIGMDLSPPESRSTSPSRKPLSKVKSMFRDRSRERGRIEYVPTDMDEKLGASPRQSEDTLQSPLVSGISLVSQRPRSASPPRKSFQRPTAEGRKSHGRIGSIKIRNDDAVGLRSIFKGGVKIDGMIRGSVSKVSDMIWKKDGENPDDSSSSTSSDDSDSEAIGNSTTTSPARTRRGRDSRTQSKHYLESLPESLPHFKPISGPVTEDDDEATSNNGVATLKSPTPVSPGRRSNHLKLPSLEIPDGASSASPKSKSRRAKGTDISDITSDTETRLVKRGDNHGRPRKTSKELHDALSAPSTIPVSQNRQSVGSHPWSIIDHALAPKQSHITKRDIARLHVILLGSGIKAMEIARRSQEPQPLFPSTSQGFGLPMTEIRPLITDDSVFQLTLPPTEIFPATAKVLTNSIDKSVDEFQLSAHKFTTETTPTLRARIEELHNGALDLVDVTTQAADDADAVSRDIVDGQRLKTKQVMDVMEKMLRRRRRRFRWARRAGWLAVEWSLVGLMWCLWFAFVVARVFVDMGRGIIGVVRWLLFL